MKLNLKIAPAIIFTLAANAAFATFSDIGLPCNHFYFGASIGIASLMDDESTDAPIHDVHYLGAKNVIGGFLVGYEFNVYSPWKFGLEAFINATNLNLSDNQNYAPQTSYTVRMRYNTGARVLPGYEFLCGTFGHIILGYSYANFRIHDDGNYGLIDKQFGRSGFQAGLGLVVQLSENFSLRTDGIYTIYITQTSKGITTATPPTTQNYHNQFSSLEGNLSIIYKIQDM